MTRAAYAAILAAVCIGCGKSPTPNHTTAASPRDAAVTTTADGSSAMQHTAADDDLQMVRNDVIQFANYRPPEATLPTRGRKIMVIAPPEAVRLAQSGDLGVVDRLLPLLNDPDRAWAAEVMLSAMTGHDSDLVLDYEKTPNDFVKDFGQGLQEAWKKWLGEVRDKLAWDAKLHRFVVK